jgi:type I restriction enzyme S subunit
MKYPAVELSGLVDVVMGQAPPGDACNKDGNGTIFVKAGEFQERNPVVREWTTKPLKLSKAGDVLVCVVGATAGKVNEGAFDCAIGRSVAAVRSNPQKLDARFLFHFLKTKVMQLRDGSQGAAQGVITKEMIFSLSVALLPLPEQRRIAAILDQADALRAKRREALAQLDSLTQSIFIEMFGDPATNTAALNFEPLESLLEESFQNGAYFPKEMYCDTGGTEMVHMSDAFGGCVKRGHLKRANCSSADVKKYALTTSDILIARRSLTYEGAAKPCMIPSATEPLIFESSFIRVRPDKTKITPLYLFHYLNNDRVKRTHIRPFVTQSTISGINQSNLAQVPVMQPTLELQRIFGVRVQSIEKMRLTQVSSLSELNTLFASLQHRAFRGEL